ncbi:MAG: membrane protein insertion efficiency factor YidD [Candidatus Margulisiibacteriota bacterium]
MSKIAIYFLILYQKLLSPYLGSRCRYYPSCSTYTIQAIEKYGLISGIFIGMKRIFRCNQLFEGGVDLLK